MLCAALNRRDMFARQRLYPGAAGGIPILADGVGLVTECGPSVDKSWTGKRVILTPARGYVCHDLDLRRFEAEADIVKDG